MENNKIGNRIKQVREELKLTQEELAQAVGMNKSTIQRYEIGHVEKIKLPVIDALAERLNVNPDWLSCKVDERKAFNESSQPNEVKLSDDVVVLARHLDEIPDEDRKELINNIQNTIEMYKKVKGIK